MYVERVDNTSRSSDLQWDTMVSESPRANVFLTRPWLETWWKHQAEEEAYLLSVRDEADKLVGIAPLVVRTNRLMGLRELTFMGTGDAAPDHLDFVTDDQRTAEITVAICQYLRDQHHNWDLLRLTDLRQDSPTRAILRQQFRPF